MGWLDKLLGRGRQAADPAREAAEARADVQGHETAPSAEPAGAVEEDVHRDKGEEPYRGPAQEYKPPASS